MYYRLSERGAVPLFLFCKEGFQLFCNVGRGRAERETVFGRAKSALCGKKFDGNGIDLPKECLHFLQVCTQMLIGKTKIIADAQAVKLNHGKRSKIGIDRDHTARAELHCGQDLVVVARIDGETITAQRTDAGGKGDIPARILEPDDPRVLGQPSAGRRGQSASRARGHVVEDEREVDGLGDSLVVSHEPRL